MQRPIAKGMEMFALVWLGQVVSLLGSGLTGFAMGIWIYQTTGVVTEFTLIYVFSELPGILISPFAGALADRANRRTIMIVSEIGAAFGSLLIIALILGDRHEIWPIYIAAATTSIFKGFQWPAYCAAITQMVPKKHFGRVSGMIQVPYAAEKLIAPILASLLVAQIKIKGILVLDLASFMFSVVTLLLARFSKHEKTSSGQHEQSSILKDAVYGWTYIAKYPGLLALVILLALTNFMVSISQVLMVPMILSFATTKELSIVFTAAGIAMMSGLIIMSTWGGPKKRVYGILGFELLLGLSIIAVGLSRSVGWIAFFCFVGLFSAPFIIGSNNAIWQSKIPADVQGRVFSVRWMVTWIPVPIAYFLAGPLADLIFEPLLAQNGWLAGTIGHLVGVGPGRGIAFLLILMGMGTVAIAIKGFQNPRLQLIEQELPDAIH